MKRGALTRTPTARSTPKAERGRVYAGGSPNFDESTGRYTAPPRGSERLSPGVYRTPSGQLMSGQGRALPSRPSGQQLTRSMSPNVQQIAENVSGQPMKRMPVTYPSTGQVNIPPGAYDSYLRANQANMQPMGAAPVDMQKPWMNFQPPQMPQAPGQFVPQSRQLSMGQVANMSGDEIQKYIDQLQQIRQMQQQQQQPGAPVFQQTTQG